MSCDGDSEEAERGRMQKWGDGRAPKRVCVRVLEDGWAELSPLTSKYSENLWKSVKEPT